MSDYYRLGLEGSLVHTQQYELLQQLSSYSPAPSSKDKPAKPAASAAGEGEFVTYELYYRPEQAQFSKNARVRNGCFLSLTTSFEHYLYLSYSCPLQSACFGGGECVRQKCGSFKSFYSLFFLLLWPDSFCCCCFLTKDLFICTILDYVFVSVSVSLGFFPKAFDLKNMLFCPVDLCAE